MKKRPAPVLKGIPVRTRLLLHAVLVTGGTLILAGGAVIYLGDRAARDYLARDLGIRADTVAWNLTVALMFDRPEEVEEVLGELRADPNVEYAWVYSEQGERFAAYHRDASAASGPQAAPEIRSKFEGGQLFVSRAIVGDDKRLGTILIAYDLDDL